VQTFTTAEMKTYLSKSDMILSAAYKADSEIIYPDNLNSRCDIGSGFLIIQCAPQASGKFKRSTRTIMMITS